MAVQNRRLLPAVQYLMLLGAIGAGLWLIIGSIVVEAAGWAARGHRQVECAPFCDFWDGRPQHEHDDQHARTLFCHAPFVVLGARRVRPASSCCWCWSITSKWFRKTSGLVSASPIAVAETSLYRVPQLLEKMMPFCILIGAMTCYLALSRRLELVVGRARPA